MLSPEWLRALSTAIPVVLAMMWVLKLQGHLWRRTVWRSAGVAVNSVRQSMGATLHPRWLGYELRMDAGRVLWSGGIRGEHTVIRTRSGVETVPGWLDADGVLEHLRSGELDRGAP